METEDLPPLLSRIWCQNFSSSELRGTNKTIAPSPSMTRPPDSFCIPTIVDIAMDDGRFTTLVAALMAADLVDTLAGQGPFTVFGKFCLLSFSCLDTSAYLELSNAFTSRVKIYIQPQPTRPLPRSLTALSRPSSMIFLNCRISLLIMW